MGGDGGESELSLGCFSSFRDASISGLELKIAVDYVSQKRRLKFSINIISRAPIKHIKNLVATESSA